VADIFQEVDEDVRRERLQKLWEKYSLYIIAGAVLIVAAVGGWKAYQSYAEKQAAAAGAKFQTAIELSEQGKHAEAQAAFDKLAGEASSGYRTLARLRSAAELAQTKPDEAVKAYDALAADSSLGQTLQDLAGVRAGMLLVDSASFADLERRLAPLAEPGRAFRSTARELLALSAWRGKDLAAARKYVDMMIADGDTPPAMRQRAQILSALIAAQSSKS